MIGIAVVDRSSALHMVTGSPGASAVQAITDAGLNDQLDGNFNREPTSRLSCQWPLSSAGDGLRPRIAPGE